MIFSANWVLNASPGPNPGAPLKSPIVSVTWPKPLAVVHTPVVGSGPQLVPTEPTPEAKFLLLNRLNISTRNCALNRSVIGMFLITEKSNSWNAGPANWFRLRFPPAKDPVGHEPTPGLQNAAGFHHCTPVKPLTLFWKE